MTTVGRLAAFLSLDSEQFHSGLRKAETSLRKFDGNVQKGLSGLSKFGATLATVAAAGGLGFIAKRALDAGDALGKMSDRTGVATEQLAGLQHAAELAGSTPEKLAVGLKMMLKNLSDASRGTGEAVKAFDILQLSAEGLAKMSTVDAMAAIADAIAGLGSNADKTAVAMKIFGESGEGLLNLLDGGGSAIRGAADEAERLGLAISRFDAAKMEKANDAITRLKAAVGGGIRQLVAELAPAIESVANGITTAIRGVISLVKNWGREIASVAAIIVGFSAGVRAMRAAMAGLAIISTIIKTVQGFTAAMRGATIAQAAFLGLSGPAGWVALAAGVAAATGAVIALNSALGSTNDEMAMMANSPGVQKINVDAQAAQDLAQSFRDKASADIVNRFDSGSIRGMEVELDRIQAAAQSARTSLYEAEREAKRFFEDSVNAGNIKEANAEYVALLTTVKTLDAASQELQASETKMLEQIAAAQSQMESAVAKLENKLEEQIDTFGMSAAQADLYKLSLDGATAEQLANAQALAELLEAHERFANVEKMIASLQEQADLFGKSAAEVELYKLALAGATDEQIKMAEAILAQIDALREQEQWAKKAERVFEQTRTPLERYAKELEELEELFRRGLIDQETFARAREDAQSRLAQADQRSQDQQPTKTADFRQVDLAELALDGAFASLAEKQASEQTQKLILKVLDEILNATREPVEIAWS